MQTSQSELFLQKVQTSIEIPTEKIEFQILKREKLKVQNSVVENRIVPVENVREILDALL